MALIPALSTKQSVQQKCDNLRVKSTKNIDSGYRYPAQIISHAVLLYHRYALSFRDVEEILALRGIVVSYESIRQWCLKFANSYTRHIRKSRGQLGDIWYLD